MKQAPAPKKLFSYTRYDWNFLSTLSPTVLGWFCVIDRIQKPVEKFFRKREKRLDAVLAYFLIETKPVCTLSQSRLYELFTPKTKYLLSHPVCQLATELRKQFNRSTQMHINLQPNVLPELQMLKQGIRSACHDWAQTIRQQPHHFIVQPTSSPPTTSPISVIVPTAGNDQEPPPAVVRGPTVVNRVQRLMGHEFTSGHPRQSAQASGKQQESSDTSTGNGAAVRKRTAQNVRSTASNKETVIEMINDNNELSDVDDRRSSGFLGKFFSKIIW